MSAKTAEELKAKMDQAITEVKPKRVSYRGDNGQMVSLDVAKQRRWARKEDGQPTKIYQHRMAIRAAVKAGTPVPVRTKTPAPEQDYAGLSSPFDLRRRSGYGTIWTVLAENKDTFMDIDKLSTEVNARLESKWQEWYTGKGYSKENPYDTLSNVIVMNRAPYNGVKSNKVTDPDTGEVTKETYVEPRSIEGLNQRVIISEDKSKAMLATNVTESRSFKKRGRKSKVEATTVEPAKDATPVEPVAETAATE